MTSLYTLFYILDRGVKKRDFCDHISKSLYSSLMFWLLFGKINHLLLGFGCTICGNLISREISNTMDMFLDSWTQRHKGLEVAEALQNKCFKTKLEKHNNNHLVLELINQETPAAKFPSLHFPAMSQAWVGQQLLERGVRFEDSQSLLLKTVASVYVTHITFNWAEQLNKQRKCSEQAARTVTKCNELAHYHKAQSCL